MPYKLTHGERWTVDGVDIIGLAPLPVSTGKQPMAVSPFIAPSGNGLLEIRQISGDIHIVQFMLFFMLSMLLMVAWWWWGIGKGWYAVIPSLGVITLGLAAMFYTNIKNNTESVANNPPVRFHPQRQQILVSWEKGNKPKPELPDILDSNKLIVMSIMTLLLIGTGWGVLTRNFDRILQGEYEFLYITIPMLILGIYPAYYSLKPWFLYLKQKKGYSSTIEVTPVDWEAVHIEYQSGGGFSPFGAVSLQSLTFTAAIPEHPDNEQVLFSIPVYSYQEALSLYELLCDFMENGAKGIEHTAAAEIKVADSGYSRKGYQQLIKKRAQETPLIYPFWRLLNLFTLRYFAHWYQEYLMDTQQVKALSRPEVIAWSARIPASQWRKPSDTLQQANKAVRKLYAKGYKWEDEAVQQVVSHYRPKIEQTEDDSPYSRLTPWSK